MTWLVGVNDWLASYGTTEKTELDPISTTVTSAFYPHDAMLARSL